jgi:hypothetical protein
MAGVGCRDVGRFEARWAQKVMLYVFFAGNK